MVQLRSSNIGGRRGGEDTILMPRGRESYTEEPYLIPEETWREFQRTGFRRLAPRQTSASNLPQEEQLAILLQVIQILQRTLSGLDKRVQKMETLLEQTFALALAESQAYYWTPDWQAKERRADEDARLGRSKKHVSVEELIQELNS